MHHYCTCFVGRDAAVLKLDRSANQPSKNALLFRMDKLAANRQVHVVHGILIALTRIDRAHHQTTTVGRGAVSKAGTPRKGTLVHTPQGMVRIPLALGCVGRGIATAPLKLVTTEAGRIGVGFARILPAGEFHLVVAVLLAVDKGTVAGDAEGTGVHVGRVHFAVSGGTRFGTGPVQVDADAQVVDRHGGIGRLVKDAFREFHKGVRGRHAFLQGFRAVGTNVGPIGTQIAVAFLAVIQDTLDAVGLGEGIGQTEALVDQEGIVVVQGGLRVRQEADTDRVVGRGFGKKLRVGGGRSRSGCSTDEIVVVVAGEKRESGEEEWDHFATSSEDGCGLCVRFVKRHGPTVA